MIGETLGEYQIVRRVGAGGMGAVYEAQSLLRNERVAVKIISTGDIARDQALVARFHREVKAAGAIATDHIVRVVATGTQPGTELPFMVMEYLDGEDLQELEKRLGPMPPELACRIVAQVCRGLEKAHSVGVVHRDIKPANLFLARVATDAGLSKSAGDQRVMKILDFGVAKIRMENADSGDLTGLTRTGSMIGSPLYMSPEQARGMKSIDHRADIWSLGVVFYQMLTGKTPNQHIEALGELILAICSEPPRPVQDLAPWVPAGVARVVHKALRFDPAERYQTAAEMLADLVELLPKGSELAEPMLRGVTEAERARVEPRFVQPEGSRASLRDDAPETRGAPRPSSAPPASLRPPPSMASPLLAQGPATHVITGTDAGMAGEAPAPASPRGSRTSLIVVGAVALGMALAVGVFVFTSSHPVPAQADTASRTVHLGVAPADAKVEIDGVAVRSQGGSVQLTGLLGSVHKVRLVTKDAEKSYDVVVSEEGALPPKVEIPPPAKKP